MSNDGAEGGREELKAERLRALENPEQQQKKTSIASRPVFPQATERGVALYNFYLVATDSQRKVLFFRLKCQNQRTTNGESNTNTKTFTKGFGSSGTREIVGAIKDT